MENGSNRSSPNVPTKQAALQRNGSRGPQVTRWCYTLFADSLDALDAGTTECPIPFPSGTKYAICQLERCPDSGRAHLQGYAIFSRSTRLGTLKKLPGYETAHWEPARGSHSAARDYCSKVESRVAGPWTSGEEEAVGSGTRNDLRALKRALDEGATDRDIAENHFEAFLRHGNGIARYRAAVSPPRPDDHQTPLTVVLGTTGLGKTRWVMAEAKPCFNKALDSKWWDGYNGTDSVLIDDFLGGIPFSELLRLANCGAYAVEQKNGRVNWNPKEIYITSNVRPDSWYRRAIAAGNINPEPLLRRITRIVHFTAYKEYLELRTDPGYPEEAGSRTAWAKYLEMPEATSLVGYQNLE